VSIGKKILLPCKEMEDLDIFQTYGDLERELGTLIQKVQQEAKNPFKNEMREEELRQERNKLMMKSVAAQNKFQAEYQQYLVLKTILDFESSFEKLLEAMAYLEERKENPRVRNYTETKKRRSSFLNTMKNKWGRLRSRSIGGKRKRKTRKV
jgi:hypothetical protein